MVIWWWHMPLHRQTNGRMNGCEMISKKASDKYDFSHETFLLCAIWIRCHLSPMPKMWVFINVNSGMTVICQNECMWEIRSPQMLYNFDKGQHNKCCVLSKARFKIWQWRFCRRWNVWFVYTMSIPNDPFSSLSINTNRLYSEDCTILIKGHSANGHHFYKYIFL